MAINIDSLNKKQLHDLLRKVNTRLKNVDKEKIGRAKAKINAVLRSEGVTFAQVYGKKGNGLVVKGAPKYRNPNGSETWTGHGMRPRWFLAALKAGKKDKDLLIK